MSSGLVELIEHSVWRSVALGYYFQTGQRLAIAAISSSKNRNEYATIT